MNEPLKPWQSDLEPESPDTGSGAYLWMAGIACGLIIAVGAQALLGHFAQRPELAQADPDLVRWIGWARWGGWGLVALSGLGWVRALLGGTKKG